MSKTVYFKQVEYHQAHLHRSMAIEEDQIIGHGCFLCNSIRNFIFFGVLGFGGVAPVDRREG